MLGDTYIHFFVIIAMSVNGFLTSPEIDLEKKLPIGSVSILGRFCFLSTLFFDSVVSAIESFKMRLGCQNASNLR